MEARALPTGWLSAGASVMAATKRRVGTVKRSIKHASGITYREASLANARPFEWAWNQRVLLGYLNLLVGIEGIGKGNLVAWILARITRGDLPGDLFGKPRMVALAGDEDSFENIWVPRLHVAGADLRLVRYIESGTNGTLDVKEDAEALREFIEAERLAVVYLDQLMDNLGVADSWKQQQVRNALAPLRAVAQETNVALLFTMHPNKRSGSFRDRVSGSPAFNEVSRSSLLVARHPSGLGRVIAVRPKGNYSAEPPAFEFSIEQHVLELGPSNKRRVITTSGIAHTRESAIRADEVLDQNDRRREDSKAGAARRALEELFKDGQPRRAADVQRELKKLHGLDARIVTRASTELGLKKWQEGFPARWWWQAEGASEDAG